MIMNRRIASEERTSRGKTSEGKGMRLKDASEG